MEYYRSAREVTLAHLDAMAVEDLDKKFYHPRRERSLLAVLGVWGHILVEEAQHLGQIAYLRGMMRGLASVGAARRLFFCLETLFNRLSGCSAGVWPLVSALPPLGSRFRGNDVGERGWGWVVAFV